MVIVEDLRRELVADIMNAASKEFGRFLSEDKHLRLTEIIYDHVKKALTPHEWNIIGECRKADQPWQEQEGYHCNCNDVIGGKPDPRPCPEHSKKN